ncbi:unnamed protein product [Rotaria magnacalcarata]|uniref:Uncharacterized protein n=4 Tax=Rotaria magnacalcarata TaxID=392030 RepID=A0A8S3CC27_9BILA|nr:unnamed protein product [Rotaria magnacalcarata]CAF4879768.1 unnamed protein product [Rotaria magnacalcarata]
MIFCLLTPAPTLIITLRIIGGFALCIASRALLHGTVALIVVGFMLLGISLFSLLIGCQAVQSHRINRMRQAVAEESKKYSMTSPTPCSWRLNVNRWWSRGRGGQHISYRLIIEIGQNTAMNSNRIPSQSTSHFPQQNDILPAPYPGSGAGFCSHCGVARQALTTNFCSSCGQPFSKY